MAAKDDGEEQLQSLRSLKKAHDLEKEKAGPESAEPVVCESVVGYECDFVEQTPARSDCPVCLLVFREPHQATCCGKVFCKACILRINTRKQPCPTCKMEDFSCYPDKGLQQELYSSRVYCPTRAHGCEWQGELGQLDRHLGGGGGEGKDPQSLDGCRFVSVSCSFCSESYLRGELEQHRSKECTKRPYTCPTCQYYSSTYDDVMFSHMSVCQSRPVNCPNKCGLVVEAQNLHAHLSSDCELVEVECEFSHAGCEARVTRKLLPDHMTNKMGEHMHLLAVENKRLKTELSQLRDSMETNKMLMTHCLIRTPPIHISYPWKKYAIWSGVFCYITDQSVWYSEPFYSHYGGYKLRLKIWCTCSRKPVANAVKGVFLGYELLESEFKVDLDLTLFVVTSVLDQENGSHLVQKNIKTSSSDGDSLKISNIQINKCIKHETMEVCVERVAVLHTVKPDCKTSSKSESKTDAKTDSKTDAKTDSKTDT